MRTFSFFCKRDKLKSQTRRKEKKWIVKRFVTFCFVPKKKEITFFLYLNSIAFLTFSLSSFPSFFLPLSIFPSFGKRVFYEVTFCSKDDFLTRETKLWIGTCLCERNVGYISVATFFYFFLSSLSFFFLILSQKNIFFVSLCHVLVPGQGMRRTNKLGMEWKKEKIEI